MTYSQEIQKDIRCPKCNSSELQFSSNQIICTLCNSMYHVISGVPVLIAADAGKNDDFDYMAHYSIDAEEFDYFEARSGATEHSERRLREYISSKVPTGVTSILDVGCGSAWVAKEYLPQGIQVCSLDASTVNPSKALTLYPSDNHTGIAADAYHLPFKDGSFPCIIAAEIIEHVTDPKRFVAELMRVLAPGGSLVLSTPYKEILKYALCIHCNQKTPLNSHLHSFNENNLRSLSGGGFSWFAFNNKLLLFARTHILLRYFPFGLWKLVDKLANIVFKKPVNIVCIYQK